MNSDYTLKWSFPNLTIYGGSCGTMWETAIVPPKAYGERDVGAAGFLFFMVQHESTELKVKTTADCPYPTALPNMLKK